jgi:hypothetical protein
MRKRIAKAGLMAGHLTEKDIDKIANEYISGVNQEFRGDAIAAVIEKFMEAQPQDKSLLSMVEDLRHFAGKPKRFHQKALLYFMIVFQYGSIEGAQKQTHFNLEQLLKATMSELDQSRKYNLDV